MSGMSRRLVFAFASTLLVSLAAPLSAFAQAWVPAKGEGALSMAVQDLFVKNHLVTTTPVGRRAASPEARSAASRRRHA